MRAATAATANFLRLIVKKLSKFDLGQEWVQETKLQSNESLLQAALRGAFLLGSLTATGPAADEYRKSYLRQTAAKARAQEQPRRDVVANIVRGEAEAYWAQFPVSKVSGNAALRHDGSLLLEPGYDPKTQLYHAADPSIVLPHMSERPTRDEALAALELLEELLDEFPFADPQVDKSVALSALMTPVLRAAIDAVPLIAVKSPAYGSGKSFLVNLVSAISTGAACPVTTVGKDEAETEKRLDAALLKCNTIISLVNVNNILCSDKLAIAVEQPMVNVRVLGLSKTINIENKACFFATGCNITVRGDMVRRTLLCSIDPNQEAPEKRTFKRNPFAEILAGRGKYIAAVLAVARAYLSDGEPPVTFTKLVSFDAWSRFVQKPLIWLGRADPVRSLETSEDTDPDRNAITEVLAP